MLSRSKAKQELHDDEGAWAPSRSQGLFSSPPGTSAYQSHSLSHYKKEPNENSTELVLPKEKVVIYKETSKLYAYCVNGNLDTLKLLFKNLKSNDDLA